MRGNGERDPAELPAGPDCLLQFPEGKAPDGKGWCYTRPFGATRHQMTALRLRMGATRPEPTR
jgi:hypothetical protein